VRTMREWLACADVSGSRWVQTLPHRRTVDQSLVALSRATDYSDAWLAIAMAGAAIDRRRRTRWIDAGARIALVELASRAVKRTLPRQRPRLEGLSPLAPTPSPMSFPSSHTAASVAALHSFDGLLPRPLLRSVALLTAFSRLYLGVHFPSDVLAGACLGEFLGGREFGR
jgi:membrane-associated phospholipid phosphatase